MKSFTEYLTESKKTYHFVVRIAGELPENADEKLNSLVERFSKVSVSKAKRTPIQETPMDFPNLNNVEVHTWEVEVNYPTTAQVMEEYLADNCGVPRANIRVRKPGDPVEIDQSAKADETYEVKLTQEDMGGESAQESVGGNRVMDLLKELEVARKEREHDPAAAAPVGESSDIGDKENTTAVVGG
jgi:hypothetical protein